MVTQAEKYNSALNSLELIYGDNLERVNTIIALVCFKFVMEKKENKYTAGPGDSNFEDTETFKLMNQLKFDDNQRSAAIQIIKILQDAGDTNAQLFLFEKIADGQLDKYIAQAKAAAEAAA